MEQLLYDYNHINNKNNHVHDSTRVLALYKWSLLKCPRIIISALYGGSVRNDYRIIEDQSIRVYLIPLSALTHIYLYWLFSSMQNETEDLLNVCLERSSV